MTANDMMTLRALLEKSSDADLLREMIGFTAERLKALERENRDLRQVNEILRKASAYFAQAELDRRFKP